MSLLTLLAVYLFYIFWTKYIFTCLTFNTVVQISIQPTKKKTCWYLFINLKQECYLKAMKEAVVAYSLRDVYALNNQLPALDTLLKKELRRDSAIWKKSMVRATSFLRDNLHQANPLIAAMIKIWHRDFEYV